MELTDEQRAYLRRVIVATDAALDAAQNHKTVIAGAVNWAALCCREARIVMSDYGDVSVSVMVEEASPDQNHLWGFVRQELESAGFGDVDVEFAW